MEENSSSRSNSHVNPDQAFLEELQEKLSKELEMPHSERNYDRIEEWTDTINLLLGTSELIDKRSKIGILQLRQEKEKVNRRRMKRIICTFVSCFCASVLIISNIWSYSVLGMSAFSAMYQVMSGGITIDFKKQENVPPESYNSDSLYNCYLAEMRRICENENISSRLPDYLPDEYTKTESFGQIIRATHVCTVIFHFEHQGSKLILQIMDYDSSDNMPPMGVPSDHYNISEQIIDGIRVCISKEDQQFTAVFEEGTIQYMLYIDNTDYAEGQKILQSMF
ncbi:MAG: hypothetical protein IJL32_02510 [Oscillospiraceae bacterium]|nr:hypothetical protein [Oscillospiraceae bacterium]